MINYASTHTDNFMSYGSKNEISNNLYPNEANNPVYQNEVSQNFSNINEKFTNIEDIPRHFKSMHIKHISHLDLDGYGATILTEMLNHFVPEGYYYIETDNILPNKLTNIVKDVIENLDYWDRVVITDLAINQELLDIIVNCKNPEKILVFDHHKCDLKDLPDNIIITKYSPIHEGHLTCATELYFNFLMHDPIFDFIKIRGCANAFKYFVECVRIYDTFEFWKTRNDEETSKLFSYIEAPRLNTLFHIFERDDFKNHIYYCLLKENESISLTYNTIKYPYISEILKLEENKNIRYVEAALRRLIKTDFCCDIWRDGKLHKLDYHIGIIFAEKNGPVIGNTACENNPELDFCAIVSNNQVSLYTNKDDIDVSVIAKLFGGGGHEEAAGLTIPYINANIYSMNHFFNIIECAGKLIPGQFNTQRDE